MEIQTFWMERTDQVAVGLRRYSNSSHNGLSCEAGYHSALVYTGLEEADYTAEGRLSPRPMVEVDPRWPTTCEHCSYKFKDSDHWQMWQDQIYRRTDNDQLRILHQDTPIDQLGLATAEPGATWDAWWMPFSKGPDGMTLMVRCPDGHDWTVDSRASNCTIPDDNEHRCWIRHGDPRECRVTVDKNGNTCQAGAGSIDTGTWHGFLHDGKLVA